MCIRDSSRIRQASEYSRGCMVFRITVVDDFTTEQGVRRVQQLLHQHGHLPILLWISIPCTGGTTWTYHNWYHGSAKTRAKILQRIETFHLLFTSLVTIMPTATQYNAHRNRVATILQILALPTRTYISQTTQYTHHRIRWMCIWRTRSGTTHL